MSKLIDDSVIRLAEQFQLPEIVLHPDELPWVPFDPGEPEFKPLRFGHVEQLGWG